MGKIKDELIATLELGPRYPVSLGAEVGRFRARAKRGLSALTPEERQAYGAAVERGILALQRTEAQAGLPPVTPRCQCASGTFHTTGEAIHKAVREQQARALAAYPGLVRRRRTDAQWREMYCEAMAEKRAREISREAA